MNPELRRNIWLEINPNRLMVTPIVLTLIGMLFYSMQYSMSYPIDWQFLFATSALVIFFVATVIWGSIQAYEGIVSEVRENTWDVQKMSSLTAWQMVIGKLLGSTIFNWYIGAFCLGIFLFLFKIKYLSVFNIFFAYPYHSDSSDLFQTWNYLRAGLLVIFIALFAQANSFLYGLLAAHTGKMTSTTRNLFMMWIFALIILRSVLMDLFHPYTDLIWWGYEWDQHNFILASLVVFTGWVWFGAYRLMSTILQIRLVPWAGLSFVIFMSIYVIGFYDFTNSAIPTLPSGVLEIILFQSIGLVWVYITAWHERRDWIMLRRFFYSWRYESWRTAWMATPNWLPVAFWVFIGNLITIPLIMLYSEINIQTNLRLVFPLIMSLLMFRDIGLLYFFSLGKQPQKAASRTILLLIMLYGILPLLFQYTYMGALFFPAAIPKQWFWLGPIIALVHVGIVFELLRNRMKNISSSISK
ncbi:hypothetical protein TI05_06120 [Achromatium sp. WMS3]|nr:hypothetical protein TI05_06120 [Achromatium sp. WMS3]